MKIIDMNGGIKVIIDDIYSISKGETLVETRDNFLEMMGRVFDEAIYYSLTEEKNDYLEKELSDWRERANSHIPNTVMMQILEEGKENYDTLREIAEYVKNSR